MPWSDIVPIEYKGMSVFTALFFMFSATGAFAILRRTGEKFKEQDVKFAMHDAFVLECKDDLADLKVEITEMRGMIRQTQMVVGRIEAMVDKMG